MAARVMMLSHYKDPLPMHAEFDEPAVAAWRLANHGCTRKGTARSALNVGRLGTPSSHHTGSCVPRPPTTGATLTIPPPWTSPSPASARAAGAGIYDPRVPLGDGNEGRGGRKQWPSELRVRRLSRRPIYIHTMTVPGAVAEAGAEDDAALHNARPAWEAEDRRNERSMNQEKRYQMHMNNEKRIKRRQPPVLRPLCLQKTGPEHMHHKRMTRKRQERRRTKTKRTILTPRRWGGMTRSMGKRRTRNTRRATRKEKKDPEGGDNEARR